LLVAAENGALPGGKVGGIGDVIRELPPALAQAGVAPVVISPSFGRMHEQDNVELVMRVAVPFAGDTHEAGVYRASKERGVEHLVIEHELTHAGRPGQIYVDDGEDRPFATDAGKFAFFCSAVASYVLQTTDKPDIIHLHDWHAAFLLILREFDPLFLDLRDTRCVYTIHNLALQGIRPLEGDSSSLRAWYPNLVFDRTVLGDPRYDGCVNPMAVGIRLADSVNTVSPGYVREILRPSKPASGFYGGEGLEADLQKRSDQGDLIGILNGCEYEDIPGADWHDVLRELLAVTEDDRYATVVESFGESRPVPLLTSVGRLTSQKVSLLLQPTEAAASALEEILDAIADEGLLVLVGSGDASIETRFREIERSHGNFVFMCGYFAKLADAMYAAGDFFLMPSSFEPCGISQMLAMRAGHPCVVHGVGGLSDTVQDGITGFVSHGDNPEQQAAQFVRRTLDAVSMLKENPSNLNAVKKAAAAQRFTWKKAATAYIENLYGIAAS